VSDPLITAGELAALLSASDRVRVLDVRWSLGGPPGRGLYREGHIPGAVYVDLETELAAHGAPTEGRHPLHVGDEAAAPGSIELSYGNLPVLSMDEAGALPRSGILLDARSVERFRGENEPIDPRAGHIPGAVSAPASENVDAHGKFLAPAQLAQRYAALGVQPSTPVGVYCGSGVTAAHDALALTIAGFTPALYPGSWSQWSNHLDRPVATGE
jgi:3-mercaptopyruvate sulfurtransferase SseA